MRLVKSSAEDVDRLALPAVLHWEARHWVVLTRLDGDRVRLADPAAGTRTVTRAELAEQWTGYAALPTPTERLADAPQAAHRSHVAAAGLSSRSDAPSAWRSSSDCSPRRCC